MSPLRKQRPPDIPEKKNPAAGQAATGALIESRKSREAHLNVYHIRFCRAIVSYRVGPDMIVQAIAFAEVMT
jgi:hypothetical protein